MANFDHTHPKIPELNFSFPEFPPVCKRSVRSINSFLRFIQFQSPVTSLATPIFGGATQKFFDQALTYVNLYQHAKNPAISLIYFRDMDD